MFCWKDTVRSEGNNSMFRAELYDDWCQKLKKRSEERAPLAQLPAFVTKGS